LGFELFQDLALGFRQEEAERLFMVREREPLPQLRTVLPGGDEAQLDLNPAICTASLKVGGSLIATTPPLQVNGGIIYAFDTPKGCVYLMTLKRASLDEIQMPQGRPLRPPVRSGGKRHHPQRTEPGCEA
jgi:hypothetical protein